jgi:hypothetical protein
VPLDVKCVFSVEREFIKLSAYDFTSQPHVRLRLFIAHWSGLNKPDKIQFNVLDEKRWINWLDCVRVGIENELSNHELPGPDKDNFRIIRGMLPNTNHILAFMAPRGIGPDAWNSDKRKQVQIRRRFMLLGQTADGMRVWDVRRAIQALRTIDSVKDVPINIYGKGNMAGIVLYASLFESGIDELYLRDLPVTHRDGPTFLNVMRFMDIPQAVAMAAERNKVALGDSNMPDFKYSFKTEFKYSFKVAENLGWTSLVGFHED